MSTKTKKHMPKTTRSKGTRASFLEKARHELKRRKRFIFRPEALAMLKELNELASLPSNDAERRLYVVNENRDWRLLRDAADDGFIEVKFYHYG